jgi:hypothetical protein
MRYRNLFAWPAAGAAMLLAAQAAEAAPLTVVNAGFEDTT